MKDDALLELIKSTGGECSVCGDDVTTFGPLWPMPFYTLDANGYTEECLCPYCEHLVTSSWRLEDQGLGVIDQEPPLNYDEWVRHEAI